MRYSVIIPCYNSKDTIDRCLNSVLRQKGDYEIILLDDRSNDGTGDILKRYDDLNSNIRLYHLNHVGPSAARNRGIEESIGEYVVFVDDDDRMCDNFFGTINNYIDLEYDLIRFKINYIGNRVSSSIFNTEPFTLKNGREALLDFIDSGKIFATPWMYVYKKSLFVDNNLYFCNNHIHEDFGLMPLIIYNASKVVSLDYVGYDYIYRFGSLSTNQSYEEVMRRADDMLYQCDFLYDYISKNFGEREKIAMIDYMKKSLNAKLTKLQEGDATNYKKALIKRNYYRG